jgi:uncharacterized protein (TIGR04255 family)
LDAFTTRLEFKIGDGRGVNISTGTILEKVVPNALSLLLDIDVYETNPLPMKLDLALSLLDELRLVKNHLFESAITDATRALFQ